MRRKGDTPDLTMARIASRQHGVIAFRQLEAIGMTKSGVTRRVRAGRLHRLHQGVYAVGHAQPAQTGWWMAAVLAYGTGAVLSHRSAAVLWGLLRNRPGLIDITVPSHAGKRKRNGIRLHRSKTLTPAATTRRHGIPVTKPARTIADLRGCVSEKELRRAARQANVLGLHLGPAVRPDRTKSDLELAFLGLCRRYDIPMPEVNTKIDGIEADFLWRDRRLVVETDGYIYHRGDVAFQDDHHRNLQFRLRGYEVLRLSAQQIDNELAVVAEALKQRLRSNQQGDEAAS
jgi:very-short-patch-repair endonuclease